MMRFRFAFLLAAALLLGACSSSPSTSNTAPSPAAASPSPQASPLTGFEKHLQFVRDGGFTYIWVFSRKDGKPLGPDDSAFLRTNAPQVVDWAITDDHKKVIGGTNFNLEEGNLAVLKKRYIAEDYSGR